MSTVGTNYVQNGDISDAVTPVVETNPASAPDSYDAVGPLVDNEKTNGPANGKMATAKRKRVGVQATTSEQTPTAAATTTPLETDATTEATTTVEPPPPPDTPSAPPDLCSPGNGTPKRRGRPATRKPAPGTTAAPPPPTPPTPVVTPNVSDNMLPGYLILNEILKMDALCKPFMNRPDEKIPGMDTYYSFISKPMWLTEIKRKFEISTYRSLREFALDMRLIFENCYRFNGPSNWCTKKALKMEQLFEEKIAQLPTSVGNICSLYATHSIKREEFVTPDDIANSTEYCSALLSRIVLENKKRLAKETGAKPVVAPPQNNTSNAAPKVTVMKPVVVPAAAPRDEKAKTETQRESDRNEIFKGMRVKLMETLSDKAIEMALEEEEKKEEEERKLRKKKKKGVVATAVKKEEVKMEEVKKEEPEEEDLDYLLEDLLEENVDETEEEKKKREEREAVDREWEDTNIYAGSNREHLRSMWELPEIAHFICSAFEVLNMEEIPLYELERMFLIPQASRGLAMLMTSLLSNHSVRHRLNEMPPMSYNVWTRKLHALVAKWYKAYNRHQHEQLTVYDIDPQFWVIMGPWNPLEEYAYHELSYHQRVWLVKGLCDYCFVNQKAVQDAVVELSFSDRDYRPLGSDASNCRYFYLRPFCEQDLRVYREALDPVSWQDKHARHLLELEEMQEEEDEEEEEEEEEEGRKRKRRGKKGGKKRKCDDAVTDTADTSKNETTPTTKKTKKAVAAKKRSPAQRAVVVRRSTRNKTEFQSYDDDVNSGSECPAKNASAKDECDTGERETIDDRVGSGGEEDENDVSIQCLCKAGQTCVKCFDAKRKDAACAQDSVNNRDNSHVPGSETVDAAKPDEPTAPSLPTVAEPTLPAPGEGRRPLQDAHWLVPDPDNFLLVADSVESLRLLIGSFTDREEEMALSLRLSKKQAEKSKAAEESLVKNLNELLEDFETFETRLVRTVCRTRYYMRRQWEKFLSRVASARENGGVDDDPDLHHLTL